MTIENKARSQAGVSPVIATTILMGITVSLGLGLWGFANTGVGQITQQYGETVTEYGRFTSDKFVVPTVAYDFPPVPVLNSNDLTVYVYNSGRFETQINSVIVSCRDCNDPLDALSDYPFSPSTLTMDLLYSDGDIDESLDGLIPSKKVRHLHFDSSAASIPTDFRPGYTYQIQVISDTGAYQTIYEKFQN